MAYLTSLEEYSKVSYWPEKKKAGVAGFSSLWSARFRGSKERMGGPADSKGVRTKPSNY